MIHTRMKQQISIQWHRQHKWSAVFQMHNYPSSYVNVYSMLPITTDAALDHTIPCIYVGIIIHKLHLPCDMAVHGKYAIESLCTCPGPFPNSRPIRFTLGNTLQIKIEQWHTQIKTCLTYLNWICQNQSQPVTTSSTVTSTQHNKGAIQ